MSLSPDANITPYSILTKERAFVQQSYPFGTGSVNDREEHRPLLVWYAVHWLYDDAYMLRAERHKVQERGRYYSRDFRYRE